jgi:hypothetical protein
LVPSVTATEYDVHDYAVAIQDRGPHVESQTAVLLLDDISETVADLVVAREEIDNSCGLQVRRCGPVTAAVQDQDGRCEG